MTRDDFKDMLIDADLKIDEDQLNQFMDKFWKDEKAAIDYKGFLRIFKKYQVQLANEERQKNAGKYVPITEATLKYKKDVFDRMDECLREQNVSLRDFFRKKVDVDRDGCITSNELMTMFKKMQLHDMT